MTIPFICKVDPKVITTQVKFCWGELDQGKMEGISLTTVTSHAINKFIHQFIY